MSSADPITGANLRANAFDIIGDVHGQFDKLVALLEHLGYSKYRSPQEVATDEVRKASRARAPDSPPGEGMDSPNGPAK